MLQEHQNMELAFPRAKLAFPEAHLPLVQYLGLGGPQSRRGSQVLVGVELSSIRLS